jgi:nitrogenase molybdenum-iron protein alpha/beta subunit
MSVGRPVQLREIRLGAFANYGGCTQELSRHAQGPCIKRMDRAFGQATVCQEWYSMFTLLTVRDAVSIIHAPIGCTGSGACMNIFSRMGQVVRGEGRITNARWVSTDLRESDIIHGGEQKLRTTIRAVEDRYHPKAIFVFTSCASGIIGDDVAGVVRETQEVVKARIALSQCEGFKTSVWASGFDAAFHAITDYLLEPRNEKDPDLVNVISPLTVGKFDEIELERLLGELGLRANFVPCFATVDALQRTVSAALTATTCATYGQYLAQELTSRYGVPHTKELMPLGIENTDRWLLQIAETLGKTEQARALIEHEHQALAGQLEPIRAKLRGKRVFVSAGQARALTLSALAAEFGFEIVGVTVYHYDQVIADSIQRLTERCGNIKINVAQVQPFEQANLLRRLKPDLYLADEMTTCWAARQGIPTVPIYDYGMTYLGYRGLIATGKRLVNALANPGFAVKLARHNPLPYRSTWYDQDPFKYIVVPEGARA